MDTLLIGLASALGAFVGLLGAATGAIARLSSMDNQRSLWLLRAMFIVDIATGTLLVAAGLLGRVLTASELAKSMAEAALYAGAMLLGVIGGSVPRSRFSGLAPGGFQHVLLPTGFIFIVLALHSWLATGNKWLGLREALSGGCLLIVYSLFVVFGTRINDSRGHKLAQQ